MNIFVCKVTLFLCNSKEMGEKSNGGERKKCNASFEMRALHFLHLCFLLDNLICLYFAILVSHLADVDARLRCGELAAVQGKILYLCYLVAFC